MRRLIYRVRRASRRLAWPWLAALVLTGAAAAFYLALVRPAGQALAAKTQRSAELHSQGVLRAAQAAELDPGLQLAHFYEQFPPRASAADWLEKVNAAAQSSRLQLMQGDYRFVAGGTRLAQYQITLPVAGSYPDIRAFITAVLAALPTASVDKVSFDRQEVGDPVVKATVRLSLYLRDEP
ncbi:MAG: type 4a pilus biogenesis protein PilO [Gallionellaceae bacterium]|nr:type 4a pilus biogenesis protein PilO [Gallionellaceae bacterium]MDD5364943.1 type 4a pilus biogenesis protein PilO [Gallionellaceae bacterium]